jgi:L-ascorbate metabolism protein UlaG (beta-lactamase superfamily)
VYGYLFSRNHSRSPDRGTLEAMRRALAVVVCLAAAAGGYYWWPRHLASRPGPDVVSANGGDISIKPVAHATLQIEQGGHAILIDPTANARFDGVSGRLQMNYAALAPPTIVLVTDDHPDHYDAGLLRGLRTAAGGRPVIVGPVAVASHIDGAVSIENGESKFVNGLRIDAVPMYNTVGQEPYHRKGHGNGYVVSVGGKRIYVAGDTACTTEMRRLKDIDVAFLPMNLPYTMTPTDAAICAVAFKPKILYAYHYRGQDVNRLATTLAGSGIEVRLRDWYAGAEPFTYDKR